MYCTKCGRKLHKNDIHCGYCGHKTSLEMLINGQDEVSTFRCDETSFTSNECSKNFSNQATINNSHSDTASNIVLGSMYRHWGRFLAQLLDFGIVFFISDIFIYLSLNHVSSRSYYIVGGLIILNIVFFSYHYLSLVLYSTSLGKFIFKLKVVGLESIIATKKQIAQRTLYTMCSAYFFFLFFPYLQLVGFFIAQLHFNKKECFKWDILSNTDVLFRLRSKIHFYFAAFFSIAIFVCSVYGALFF